MSLGSPGSGEGIQQHDLSDYKNALLTVSRPRPPAVRCLFAPPPGSVLRILCNHPMEVLAPNLFE